MPEAKRKLRVGESRRAGRRRRPVLLLLALAAALSACADSDSDSDASELGAWSTYGGGIERTFYNANETAITRDTVGDLVPLWRFTTGAVVTASPIVANVEIADDSVEVVFIASWDGFFYALRAADGTELWNYRLKPHPGASYPQASSATVADVDGERRVYVGGGMTLYCFDAASGALLWEFDAGTGCTDCDFITERNEILSSPAVYGGLVYFGMDINDFGDGKGGFYALDARDGRLRWYFDLETAATCTPDADDDVRRFLVSSDARAWANATGGRSNAMNAAATAGRADATGQGYAQQGAALVLDTGGADAYDVAATTSAGAFTNGVRVGGTAGPTSQAAQASARTGVALVIDLGGEADSYAATPGGTRAGNAKCWTNTAANGDLNVGIGMDFPALGAACIGLPPN